MGEWFGKTNTDAGLRFPQRPEPFTGFDERIAETRRAARERDRLLKEAQKNAAVAKKAREDEAEERALRVEAMKVAAMMDQPTRVSWTRLKENAEQVLSWMREETDKEEVTR